MHFQRPPESPGAVHVPIWDWAGAVPTCGGWEHPWAELRKGGGGYWLSLIGCSDPTCLGLCIYASCTLRSNQFPCSHGPGHALSRRHLTQTDHSELPKPLATVIG